MNTSSIELADGQFAGALSLEVTSIPDVSIIGGGGDDSDKTGSAHVAAYRRDAENFLGQIFQGCKNATIRDTSIEIFWTTSEAVNQAYRANIRLFVILRMIQADKGALEVGLSDMLAIVRSALSLGKYEFREVQFPEVANEIGRVAIDTCKAFCRDETVSPLQNQMLPECYSFDRIPVNDLDLSRISNALTDYPGCAVSFQLIPTSFSPQETAAIDRMSTALGTLSKGVRDQSMGNVAFALAEKESELYQYYSARKNAPLFSYNILVMGRKDAIGAVSSGVYGLLNGASDGNVAGRFVDIPPQDFDFKGLALSLPWAANEYLMERDRRPEIWQTERRGTYAAFWRLPFIITAEEASTFFRLPIGSPLVSAGLVVNKAGKDGKTYADGIVNAGDITVGRLKSSAHGDTIGFSLRDLTKHMLVVGTPGSGKTTFSVSLLDRLWKQHHIPFLVIEPAKNEYRALVQSIPDIQIFTPGKNFISPFVFNPFVPPKNVTLESYKSVLKTAFAAAVTMSTPLDKIFEEAVNNCYSDFRWLDTYTTDDKGRIFNIQDFVRAFQQTFDAIGYTGDARNIGRAGLVRLNSLVNLFDNYHSVPIEDILTKPAIIELAAIENGDQKALIIALLLLSILSYVNRNYVGDGKLRNVLLLEEAHVLLDSDSKVCEGAADPSAIAKGLVKRMLAEIRSYGVGIVIADQSPRKVGTDVVALTNIKLAFRLVEREDKEILSDSTNMSDVQTQRLARLRPGEAMFFFDRLEEPEEVKTEDYRAANNISISLSDDSIRERTTYWNGKEEMLRPYPECAYVGECSGKCDFGCRALAREIARRIYAHDFTPATSDFGKLKSVYSRMSALIKAELNDEPITPKLGGCVRMQFLRKIKYGTAIRLTDGTIRATLEHKRKESGK